MKGPLLLRPDEILDTKKRNKPRKVEEKTFKALNRRESGVRGKKAMKKIVRNVEKLDEDSDSEETQMDDLSEFEYLGRIEEKVESKDRFGGKMPWEREEERFILRRMKKESVPTTAELILDEGLLNRLRREASKMRKWVNVRKAGVTELVVNKIKSMWKLNELAMVRFDVPLCRNMERAQEIIEVWLVLLHVKLVEY
jgi:RNA-binding protein YhbY